MSDRFKKIEPENIQTGLVKKAEAAARFAKLETNEERQQAKVPEEERQYFPCPFCGRNNKKGRLYCIYCGKVFPELAEKTEGNLAPYQKKCPQCGQIVNISQKRCLWCGFAFEPTAEDILRHGKPVEIEIEGKKYSSTDPYLPPQIKEALLAIKKEGSSSEKVEAAIREIRKREAESILKAEQMAEKARYRAAGAGLLIAGGLLMFIFRVVIRIQAANISGWLFLLAAVGGILTIAGLAYLALGFHPEEVKRSSFYW
ncbi:MAG: zinc ribbon domain-containing protein [Candidatus Omnitrophica bacterium]|nr:zinc ribbon domain-containing protein [Candidatus Omnitrophota bacterium]